MDCYSATQVISQVSTHSKYGELVLIVMLCMGQSADCHQRHVEGRLLCHTGYFTSKHPFKIRVVGPDWNSVCGSVSKFVIKDMLRDGYSAMQVISQVP